MKRYQLHPPMGAFPPATMMETTRGCSFPCDFCCLSMPVRYKSPEQVEKEIRNLQKDFGIKEVHFVDPTFTLHRERAEELCDHIKTLGIKWSCKTRVDLMPEKLVHKMAESGCYLVAFGVESGDELILKNLQKKAAAESAVETFARCRKHKIRTTAYLLVANPGETDETVQTNIDFVKKLHPDYVLYDILQVDPGNPLTWKMIRQGLFTEDDLNRYYMTDEHTRLHEISVCGHESETAKAWIKKASAAFYLRPSYFAERIIDLRSIQDAANLGSGGFTFLKDLFSIGKLWNK